MRLTAIRRWLLAALLVAALGGFGSHDTPAWAQSSRVAPVTSDLPLALPPPPPPVTTFKPSVPPGGGSNPVPGGRGGRQTGVPSPGGSPGPTAIPRGPSIDDLARLPEAPAPGVRDGEPGLPAGTNNEFVFLRQGPWTPADDPTGFGFQQLDAVPLPAVGLLLFRYRAVDPDQALAAFAILQRASGVVLAQPNLTHLLQAWPVAKPVPQARPVRLAAATRSAGAAIALIDSAVDASHPALSGAPIELVDVVEDGDATPGNHGTALAGIMLEAVRDAGAEPMPIIAVRAFVEASEGGGDSTSFLIGRAIDVAIGRGAAVLNLSFAGPSDQLLAYMIDQAVSRGIVVVAAAGNAGPQAPPAYPAALEPVIAVTATDARDRLFKAANRGPYVQIAAYGVDVLVPAPGNRYGHQSGTSLAAAYVSAAIAVLLDRDRNHDRSAVVEALEGTAVDLGPPGRDTQFGVGRLDMAAAMDKLDGGAVGN
ncbi:MAG: S8 family serine peptidase [Alphaproteobacteria bacterium]|nr:S8 family serine peptidase [Alphaproteobacteria bacterium]